MATTPEGSPKAPRVSFYTLGCRLNQYDTAALRARLAELGAHEASPASRDTALEGHEGDGTDVIVVNTCTVTRRADQEARQLIRSLHRRSPASRIVVTGCYAQRAPEELRGLSGVHAVLGAVARDDPRALRLAVLGADPITEVAPGRDARVFSSPAPLHAGRSRALLKIQDGCDSFCAFCVVPYVRGRSRSLPRREALERARRLLETGFHEIVLTGADLGSYGRDLGERRPLARLVREILELGERHRVRLSSIEPNKVDLELAEMVGREPRLCRHLHLPLQSGSDRVLRAMRRGYTRSEYARLLDRVLARGPVAIGTDVIVGFPGEDEAEFEETRNFLERAPLTFLHVFRYSARPGTAAARLESATTDARSRERSEILRALGDAKAAAFRRALVGSTLPVVLESGRGTRGRIARSDLNVPVELLREPEPDPGIFRVAISGEEGNRLVGAPLSENRGAPHPL